MCAGSVIGSVPPAFGFTPPAAAAEFEDVDDEEDGGGSGYGAAAAAAGAGSPTTPGAQVSEVLCVPPRCKRDILVMSCAKVMGWWCGGLDCTP